MIEIDGDSHNDFKNQKRDFKKDEYLHSIGLTVIRIDDLEVKQNISVVVEELLDWIKDNEHNI